MNTKPINRHDLDLTKKDRPSRSEPDTRVNEQAQQSYLDKCREKGVKAERLPDFARMYDNNMNIKYYQL